MTYAEKYDYEPKSYYEGSEENTYDVSNEYEEEYEAHEEYQINPYNIYEHAEEESVQYNGEEVELGAVPEALENSYDEDEYVHEEDNAEVEYPVDDEYVHEEYNGEEESLQYNGEEVELGAAPEAFENSYDEDEYVHEEDNGEEYPVDDEYVHEEYNGEEESLQYNGEEVELGAAPEVFENEYEY